MADLFTITGTLEQGALARDAICANYKYQETVRDQTTGESIPNPENKTDFSKRMILTFIRNSIRSYRANLFNAGRQTIIESADAESNGMTVE